MAGVYPRCLTTLDVGKKPSSGESWESFQILFHRFADLSSEVGEFFQSPKFTCNGHEWCLRIYPGGYDQESERYLSVYLEYCSEWKTTASYEICVLGKHRREHNKESSIDDFIGKTTNETWGWPKYCKRSNILSTYLDDDGTLAIVVFMKRDASSPFVPNNPMSGAITSMFLDEETADVCFEVSDVDANADDRGEAASSPITFYAHRLILKACAPMLASLFGSDDDEVTTVSITDVKPAIFRHMLYYVYGGSVPDGEMKIHAKDIINAADFYSIVSLKLEAEAAYVKSTEITMDNFIDIVLYADSMNCAFMKEVVMDFLTQDHGEAIKNVSFADLPGHLMKDLIFAFGRKAKGATEGNSDDLSVMRVGELRRELAELGLDVDGSREAMTDALRANAQESADADEADDSHDDDNAGVDLLEEEE